MERANEESVVVCKMCGFEFNFTKVRVKLMKDTLQSGICEISFALLSGCPDFKELEN